MGLREQVGRLRRRVGVGKPFAGATVCDLANFGFLSDAPAERRQQASQGVQRLAIAVSLRVAVTMIRRARSFRAVVDDPAWGGAAELERLEAEAAEAADILGVAADADDGQVVEAALARGRREGLSGPELKELAGFLAPPSWGTTYGPHHEQDTDTDTDTD